MTEKRLEAPMRTLMGPGPLDIHPRVYRALTSPVIGHLDPAYLEALDRIRELLKMVFQTKNELMFFLSCLSHALAAQGHSTDLKSGLAAAMETLEKEPLGVA